MPTPLEKPAAEKIKRKLGYSKVKNEMNKWNGLVQRNRLKDHLTFPLENNQMKIQDSTQFLSKFKVFKLF